MAESDKAVADRDNELAAGLRELRESAGWIDPPKPSPAERLRRVFGGTP